MTAANTYRDGPAFYWRLMRASCQHYGHFTPAALCDMVGDRDRHTIQNYVRFLRETRVIRLLCEERYGAAITQRFVIDRDGEAPPAPRIHGKLSGAQQALWVAMRGLATFTPAELAMAAATEERIVTPETARSFVFDLKNAGYLAALNDRRYRLLPAKNTGPISPIVLRKERAVFDLNLMRTVKVTPQSPVKNETGRAA